LHNRADIFHSVDSVTLCVAYIFLCDTNLVQLLREHVSYWRQ